MTERRCHHCRRWYPVAQRACPGCGTEPPAFNIHLKAAACNGQLYSQAASAAAEKLYAETHGV